MGALQGNRCYATQADALDALYLGAPVQIVSGQTSYTTIFEKVSGVWKSSAYSINESGVWSLRYQTNAPVPVFPECNPAEGLIDGLAVGWLIASAMIAAAALLSMKKGAR